jgi:hypothetical protein
LLCTAERLEYDVKWARKKRVVATSHKQGILAGVNEHRAALLREWEAKVSVREVIADE